MAAPKKLTGKPKHHAALPYAELPQFMKELRAVAGVPARALEFLILTASRSGEVFGATWDEIDLDGALWTIPASRMKARAEHRVPLSARAVEILRTLPREDRFVFICTRAGAAIGKMAMPQAL